MKTMMWNLWHYKKEKGGGGGGGDVPGPIQLGLYCGIVGGGGGGGGGF